MRAGLLRDIIEIQRATITNGATGQQLTTWATITTAWARVKPVRSEDTEAQTTYTVTLRYNPALLGTDRLVWSGQTLNIFGQPVHDERRTETTLTVMGAE